MPDDPRPAPTPGEPRAPDRKLPYAPPRLTLHGPLDPVTQINGGTVVPTDEVTF